MASFRIYRMRPHVKLNFRWAPHVAGMATVKQRDYLPGAEFLAANEYALWAELKGSEQALEVGDLVESAGVLKICKFVGFESARWAETDLPASASLAQSGVTESGVNQAN